MTEDAYCSIVAGAKAVVAAAFDRFGQQVRARVTVDASVFLDARPDTAGLCLVRRRGRSMEIRLEMARRRVRGMCGRGGRPCGARVQAPALTAGRQGTPFCFSFCKPSPAVLLHLCCRISYDKSS
jgi:hypothetical protein